MASAGDPLAWTPTLMLAPRSCPILCKLPLTGGEVEPEARETVLSEGAKGLADRGAVGGVGGARPFPLPRMRPPPSLRPDMVGNQGEWFVEGKKKKCGGGSLELTRRPELVELRPSSCCTDS